MLSALHVFAISYQILSLFISWHSGILCNKLCFRFILQSLLPGNFGTNREGAL